MIRNDADWHALLRDIEAIPVVDVHSHLNPRQLEARDLTSICLYHMIGGELRGAGFASRSPDTQRDPRGSMARGAPYFRHIRNTSFHWCMMSILRDLYGFDADTITEENWETAWDLVAEKADSGFAARVRERVGIRKILTNFPDTRDPDAAGREQIFPCREESLGSVGAGKTGRDWLRGLGEKAGMEIATPNNLGEALAALFASIHWERLYGAGAWLRATADFSEIDEAGTAAAIRKHREGTRLSETDEDALNSFAVLSWLGLLRTTGLPFQIAFGSHVLDRHPFAASRHRSLRSLAVLFRTFPDVHFNVLLAAECHSHALNTIAKTYPNVSVASAWWHGFYPSILRRMLKDRLEMLPVVKIVGYFTDAYCIDWAYARLKLTRVILAQALHELIHEGFYTPTAALRFAEDLLWNNPHRIWPAIGEPARDASH